MSGYVQVGDHCGEGTSWGCGLMVQYPARLLLNARPPLMRRQSRGIAKVSRHVLFHPDCWPEVATVPAFRKGLEAELRSGQWAVPL